MKRPAILLAMLLAAAVPGVSAMEAASGAAAPSGTDATVDRCLSSWSDPGSEKALCIAKESFNRDLCDGIAHFAKARRVPADFLARLIWRESLFRPDAVSPKGAEGIAQFMPGTARLRGLENSFDILSALQASATYLAELADRFGSYGLAAAAYNAGEGRLRSYLAGGTLPYETRAYVLAITGASVEQWSADAPEQAAAPLDGDTPFVDSCVALADSRRLSPGTLIGEGSWAPWGVQLAAHLNPEVARGLFARAIGRLPESLRDELPIIVRQTGGNFGYRPRYAARIGRDSRAEAQALCARIKDAGGSCTVLRN
ncbi:MAG: lytic transglycosylase domain-containing protein [Pseudorhizobium sp.]